MVTFKVGQEGNVSTTEGNCRVPCGGVNEPASRVIACACLCVCGQACGSSSLEKV